VANVLLSSSAMNKAFNPKVRKSERERKIKWSIHKRGVCVLL
jgi:hypothetical protein